MVVEGSGYGDAVYEVERLLGERIRGGSKEYLIRWVGWAPEHDSWEKEISVHTPELIKAFNRSQSRKRPQSSKAKEVAATNGAADGQIAADVDGATDGRVSGNGHTATAAATVAIAATGPSSDAGTFRASR